MFFLEFVLQQFPFQSREQNRDIITNEYLTDDAVTDDDATGDNRPALTAVGLPQCMSICYKGLPISFAR